MHVVVRSTRARRMEYKMCTHELNNDNKRKITINGGMKEMIKTANTAKFREYKMHTFWVEVINLVVPGKMMVPRGWLNS